MTREEETYLKFVHSCGHNDYHPTWKEDEPVRKALVGQRVIRVRHMKAAHMGDVDVVDVQITARGQKLLRQLLRRPPRSS